MDNQTDTQTDAQPLNSVENLFFSIQFIPSYMYYKGHSKGADGSQIEYAQHLTDAAMMSLVQARLLAANDLGLKRPEDQAQIVFNHFVKGK